MAHMQNQLANFANSDPADSVSSARRIAPPVIFILFLQNAVLSASRIREAVREIGPDCHRRARTILYMHNYLLDY